MFNVTLAGDHLYGKLLFNLLSLMMSLMVSYFVLFFSQKMSWMRTGTELSQSPRIFLPTLDSSSTEMITLDSSRTICRILSAQIKIFRKFS